MGGEIVQSGSAQPGGRAAAPGELALVQAFVNSHYDLEVEHGAELLSSPSALAAWLARHGLSLGDVELGAGDLARALTLREGLRSLARSRTEGRVADWSVLGPINDAVRGGRVEIRFGPAAPAFVPATAGLDASIATIASITARAMLVGTWARLKICAGEHCGWAFYDHSRNLTGRRCSMSVCGARAKARAHYRRRRVEGR